MRIKSIKFNKSIMLGRDKEYIGLTNGQEVKGPDWVDGATLQLALEGQWVILDLRSKEDRLLTRRSYPASRIEEVIWDIDSEKKK